MMLVCLSLTLIMSGCTYAAARVIGEAIEALAESEAQGAPEAEGDAEEEHVQGLEETASRDPEEPQTPPTRSDMPDYEWPSTIPDYVPQPEGKIIDIVDDEGTEKGWPVHQWRIYIDSVTETQESYKNRLINKGWVIDYESEEDGTSALYGIGSYPVITEDPYTILAFGMNYGGWDGRMFISIVHHH